MDAVVNMDGRDEAAILAWKAWTVDGGRGRASGDKV